MTMLPAGGTPASAHELAPARAAAAAAAAASPAAGGATVGTGAAWFDPAAPTALHAAPTPTGPNSNGGSLKIGVSSSVGTAQGIATTAPLPGDSGDYLRLHSMGTVGVSAADGRTVWQLTGRSLFAAWHLSPSNPAAPQIENPEAPLVRNSADPFKIWIAEQDGVADMHPEATGYLAGSRVPDVAIAETAGVTVGLSGQLEWPFNVPGSRLHAGTFVTVLNGLTGQVLWSELDPGYVTQLAIVGGTLVVGDETGDPDGLSPLGAWRSTTAVHALSFRQAGDRLVARTAWTYSTGAPWAALLDMQPVGSDVAVDWSDTPEGLGVPGPSDGHVVLIGPDGSVRWNVPTPGYPILSSYDASRQLLVIADETDPTVSIGYALAGLRVSDGSTAVSVPVAGVLPTALSVSDVAGRQAAGGWGSTWFTGGVVTTKRQADGENFGFSAGQVTAVDPGSGRVLWSTELTGRPGHAPYPATVLAAGSPWAGGLVLVASGTGFVNSPTPGLPIVARSDLRVLSAGDGQLRWDRSGDVADSLSVRLAGPPWEPQVSGVTDEQDAVGYDLGTGAVRGVTPLMGDLDAAVRQDINGESSVIVGSQSGGVYALDASDLSRVIWQAYAGGPVHQIALARPLPDAPPVLVVAATTRVDVLNLRTGRIQVSRDYPGQYAWNVTVGRIGSHRAGVVVATSQLSAFDAGTGRSLWTYRPPVPSYFSDAVIVDGVTVADYQNKVAHFGKPTTMAAVGIGAAGKVAWTAPASVTTTTHPVLWNGVFASPAIAGAGSTGVALSWQNTRGGGRVDLRDALTGALLYADNSAGLYGLMGWTVDPPLGVIAVGNMSSVLIRPGHPLAVEGATGTSAAVVDSAGKPVVLFANRAITAYPGSTVKSLRGLPAATNSTFTPGTLVPAGPAASGQVIALPQDLLGWEIVDGTEEGVYQRLGGDTYQIGADLLTVTGTPPAVTAPRPVVRRAKPPRPASMTVAAPRPGMGTALPQLRLKVHGYTGAGKPILAQTAPAGYDPATIGAYLGLTGDGSGQTVAVIDAYTDPDIVSDVNEFSAQFGLPKVCGTPGAGQGSTCFDFKATAPDGTAGQDPGWALETSLDIEWVHAIAPKAAVRLVEAHDQTFAALFAAVTDAAARSPDAISMSWGDPGGEFSGETYYDGHCELAHSVCVAASGDYGHPGEYPAYNPRVLAIGGTTLGLAPGGTVASEVPWSGSGGGRSYFEPKPAAQRGVAPGSRRGIPDVSFDADPNTGVAIYDSVPFQGQAGWFEVGGTSVGAPTWSAILASADQLRAAAGKGRLTSAGDRAARAVYGATSALADITTGPPNGACPKECLAGPGYDYVTGLGSPRAGIDAAIAAAP
jgi:hypothetical protein